MVAGIEANSPKATKLRTADATVSEFVCAGWPSLAPLPTPLNKYPNYTMSGIGAAS